MAFQVVPDTASFRIMMKGTSNQDIVNTIYVRNVAVGWNAAHLNNSGAAIGDAWRDAVMPLVNDGMLLDRVETKDEGAEFGAETTLQYNTAGSRVGARLTPAIAALVQLTCGESGAPRQGRLFVGALVEEDVVDDNLATAYATLLLAAVDAVDAAIATISGDAWVVISRYSKTANPVAPHKRVEGITNAVTARSIRSMLATQRDRRVGIGS